MSGNPEEQRTVAPDGRPMAEQPDWRRDFPIDVPQDNYVARRDFTKFLGLTSLAFLVGQLWIAARGWLRGRQESPGPRPVVLLAQVPVGGALTFSYPGDQDVCLLLRPAADSLVAYSQKCTHLSCAVMPDVAGGRLHCPCHHGAFDLPTGRPLAGPARRPLPRIALEVRDGTVYATGVELRTA
jgi:Rieske Fe-S protein